MYVTNHMQVHKLLIYVKCVTRTFLWVFLEIFSWLILPLQVEVLNKQLACYKQPKQKIELIKYPNLEESVQKKENIVTNKILWILDWYLGGLTQNVKKSENFV